MSVGPESALEFVSVGYSASIIITPILNWYGGIDLDVSAFDGEFLAEQSFNCRKFYCINDSPIIDLILDQNIDEDGFLELSFCNRCWRRFINFLIASAENAVVGLDNFLTVIPDADYFGEIEVNVLVSDGQLTDSEVFVLTVNPVNDAPIIDGVSDQVIDEDGSLELTLSAFDVDQDDLVFFIKW